MKRLFAAGVLAFALLNASVAAAGPIFRFDGITNNIAGDVAIGEAQLSVEVLSLGSSVGFLFRNVGSAASSITDVYFMNGPLGAFQQLINGTGVLFEPGASPGNLPGGNSVGFVATSGYTFDSANPTQPRGVNPGETLQILFAYGTGQTFDSVVSAIYSGALRIGIHVQGFATGGSESFVAVPEPGPLALFGVLALAGVASRFLQKRRAAFI